jgi:DNA-binding GntR family transcriptional regulator
MQDNDQMAEPTGGPAYQQVADDLRHRIAAAEFPIGSAIPSTAKLCEMYGVSVTVVRAAVAQLRAHGLVTGYPGKGVFVSSTPKALGQRAVTIGGLANQIEELRAELHEAESARRKDAASEVAALRAEIAQVQAQVSGLYAHLGISHSEGEPADGSG